MNEKPTFRELLVEAGYTEKTFAKMSEQDCKSEWFKLCDGGRIEVKPKSKERANMTNLVFIGERFYSESGTILSSLYEAETGKRYDWGFVQRDLRNGITVNIRPATAEELQNAEIRLQELQARRGL